MPNEQWNTYHAMATVQANEPKVVTKVYSDAGEGQMLSNGNRILMASSNNGLAMPWLNHSLELITNHSRESWEILRRSPLEVPEDEGT